MSFRDNLQHLRATRGMTQEQLAMMVGVSRQSVTKWESERAYPEMDKLLKLCSIFDCTLDELVQGDLTDRGHVPGLSVPDSSLMEDVTGYDEHMTSYARRIASGVTLIILGVACSAVVEGVAGDSLSLLMLFAGIAAGLALIVPSAFEHSAFVRSHPYLVNFYSPEQRISERRVFGRCVAGGIGAILLGVGFGGVIEATGPENIAAGALLLCVAAGVGLIVYGVIMNGRLDIEDYNISALEDLSEDEVAGIVGSERASQVYAKVRASRLKGRICGLIMLVATIIALGLLMWAPYAHSSFWMEYFWAFWPLGGILCAVASIVLDMRHD